MICLSVYTWISIVWFVAHLAPSHSNAVFHVLSTGRVQTLFGLLL